MSIYNHNRFKITTPDQHPLKHRLADFFYNNDSAVGVANVEDALDYILAVLYPKTQPVVDTVADLPLVGNNIGDYRNVLDDGDGKAAGYWWSQYDGESAPSWHKVYDVDWGSDEIANAMVDKTQFLYVFKQGQNDYDENGVEIAGEFAGQSIFGGNAADTNLILNANSGDIPNDTGVNDGPDGIQRTGHIKFNDHVAPTYDDFFRIGEDTKRFNKAYINELEAGSLVVNDTGITKGVGATIDFGSSNIDSVTNLTASFGYMGQLKIGTAAGVTHEQTQSVLFGITNYRFKHASSNINFYVDGRVHGYNATFSNIKLDDSTIAPNDTGVSDILTVSFSETQLQGLSVSSFSVDDITIDGNTISSSSALNLEGTSGVSVTGDMTTGNITTTGNVGITGRLDVDKLSLNDNLIIPNVIDTDLLLSGYGTGTVKVGKDIYPETTDTKSIGSTAMRFVNLFLSGSIGNAAQQIAVGTLLKLKDILFRADGTTPIADGDQLTYSSALGKFVAEPKGASAHADLTGLDADDHTQYALLAGRSGGQSLLGSNDATGAMYIKGNTAGETVGIGAGKISVSSDATMDIGDSTNAFANIYMDGQAYGLRVENEPIEASILTRGKAGALRYAVNTETLFLDTGTSVKKVGGNSYKTITGVGTPTSTLTYNDVSPITDARTAIWQFKDADNNNEVMGVKITSDQTSVTITTDIPLPVGNYRLIGIEA